MKEEEGLLGIRREFEKTVAVNRKHDWRVSIGPYEAWDHSIRSYMWITETSQKLCERSVRSSVPIAKVWLLTPVNEGCRYIYIYINHSKYNVR